MRGKGHFVQKKQLSKGITPAYAGKSCTGCTGIDRIQDHPRLCGEKPDLIFVGFHMSGSPPPMRGKVCSSAIAILAYRITPAYAGKRHIRDAKDTIEQDHPRLCGEKFSIAILVGVIAGSPPPMRGKAS